MCLRIVFLVSVMSLLTAADRSLGIAWTNGYPGDDSWCTSGNWAGGAVPGPLDAAEISTPPERGPVIDCNVNVGRIEGPNPAWGSVQVMDVVEGTVVTDTWLWHSGTGTATINVSGSPHITIYGYGWRGPDDGTGILNISGEPNITVEGDLRGADASGQFVMNMSGGSVRCGRFKIGDDGGGELNVSEGHLDVTGEMRLGTRAFADIAVNMTGGSISVGGPITANPQGSGAVSMNLREGTMRCGALTHGMGFQTDIEQGVLVIEGDVRADIEADIAAGYVTAYGGKGAVAVDFNNINPGSTTISASPRIIYVDADAAPGGDGASWATAFKYLQDGLAVAASGDEIWVAEGVYKPDEDTAHPDGSGARNASFQLISGVAIYGSYAGFGEPNPNARDAEAYETTLSGDLNGDDSEVTDPVDMLYDLARSENSYHVVVGSGTDETAILDGFTITAGNANVDYWRYGSGGAMFNENGSPTLASCRLIANLADNGGAVYNKGHDGECRPILINCVFSGNYAADEDGGAMYNSNSRPRLAYCSFTANSTSDDGGAMYNHASTPTLTNCTFRGNFAFGGGGAMSNRYHSNPALTNCTFTANLADTGGAIGNLQGSSPTLTNCIFTANLADTGGAMYTKGTYDAPCHPTLTNCTFAQNSANNGSALACDSFHQSYPGDLQLTNCVLWDGGSEIWNNDNSLITITYSDVEGSWPGEGNIDSDPCFVAAGYWDASGVWVEGDYHLLPDSPCIDAGDNNSVPADMHDLDGDGNTTEPIPWDLDGKPRIVDGNNDGNSVVDMGAYEANYVEVQMKFTPQALNPGSQGNWFKLHFVLPEGFTVEDVDVSKPALCKLMDTGDVIKSVDMNVFVNEEDLVKIEAFIDRGALSLCRNGQAERNVAVLGILCGTGGQDFYGTDTIKIINKTWEQLAGLTLHWLEEGCGEPDWCGGIDLNQDGAVDFVDLALFDGCCIEIIAE